MGCLNAILAVAYRVCIGVPGFLYGGAECRRIAKKIGWQVLKMRIQAVPPFFYRQESSTLASAGYGKPCCKSLWFVVQNLNGTTLENDYVLHTGFRVSIQSFFSHSIWSGPAWLANFNLPMKIREHE